MTKCILVIVATVTISIGSITAWGQTRTEPAATETLDRAHRNRAGGNSANHRTRRYAAYAADDRNGPRRYGATANRHGRGGAGGPPLATNVDETPVVTHHKMELDGKTIEYTVTVAQMPIKDNSGETKAHICYFAYTLKNAEPTKRPLTFAFNGGPGSASIWVHMGAMGPRKVLLTEKGDMPQPPFGLIDNPNTWLDQTDLVFIDPVGTGYSRAKTADVRAAERRARRHSIGRRVRAHVFDTEQSLDVAVVYRRESYGTFLCRRPGWIAGGRWHRR